MGDGVVALSNGFLGSSVCLLHGCFDCLRTERERERERYYTRNANSALLRMI